MKAIVNQDTCIGCGLFKNVCFPMNEFFPPNTVEMPKDYNGTRSYCACR